MFDLIGDEGLAFIEFLALFFVEKVFLCSGLELRILAIGEIGVGSFKVGVGLGGGGHGLRER